MLSSSSILETPVMTETLHQEPALCGILTNDDPSCSPERREPEIPAEPGFIGSSHQNAYPHSSSSFLEAPVIIETLHQEPALPGILTNDNPSCSADRHEPEIPLDPRFIGSSPQNVFLPGTASSHENDNNVGRGAGRGRHDIS
ncbi:unnamed protein product [Parnassius apollo]|uniref:(apollo) hypothetical protein n=1 Tax=Parnassius apollo TaxID=110799 RepID=A0A8S3XPI2_PARAO|nr:unnamed protein product [Parnassius apollo]